MTRKSNASQKMIESGSIFPFDEEEGASKEASSSCNMWTRSTDKDGYGQTCWQGTKCRAHRVAYCQAHGLELSDIKGMNVCHTCDTPGCVNPDHLFLGTQKDNMQDCARKGRSTRLQGEAHGRSKLTDVQVAEIRRRYIPGIVTQQQLADEFGVCLAHIHRIITYKNRKRD